jgi:hypothetical protein
MLPAAVKETLARHLEQLHVEYRGHLPRGEVAVHLPDALARTDPKAPTEWAWQWVFPASERRIHPRTREEARFHLHESVLQRAVKQAVYRARFGKHVGWHTFRTASPYCP